MRLIQGLKGMRLKVERHETKLPNSTAHVTYSTVVLLNQAVWDFELHVIDCIMVMSASDIY